MRRTAGSFLAGVLLLAAVSGAWAQPWAIGHTSVTWIDADRGGRQVPAQHAVVAREKR